MSTENGHKHDAIPIKKCVLLCVILYLLFVAIQLPADRVWPEVLKRAGVTGQQVRLADGEGSWLDGSFNTVIIAGNDAGGVSFQLKPWYFLAGSMRVGLDLKKGDGGLRGDVELSPWSIGLYDFNGEIPFDLINKMAVLPGLELFGVVRFSDLEILLKKSLLSSASGEVFWEGAGMKAPYNLTAGDFEAVIKTDQEGVKINATDKGGDVMLRVAGTVTPEGNYGINGEFGARDSAHPDLVSFLKIMGEPGPDGRVRLSHRGSLKQMIK